MRSHRRYLVISLIAVLFCPFAALAKRKAPKPVAPLTREGVEYSAKMGRSEMGFVEAKDILSGKTLWRTRVYRVWYVPLTETDVQDVFITNLAIQNDKLLVQDELGRGYWLDLKTGRVDGAMRYWMPCALLGTTALLAGFFMWRRLAGRGSHVEARKNYRKFPPEP